MRIYNGTKKTLTLPYAGGENLTIAPKTPSGNVLCSTEFLSTLVTSYGTDEIAIIASGPFEITACANVATSVNYVVQSLEEAILRFHDAEPEKIDKKVSDRTLKATVKKAAKKVKKVELELEEEKEETPADPLVETGKEDVNPEPEPKEEEKVDEAPKDEEPKTEEEPKVEA